VLWLICIAFFIESNAHFGWNWMPKSDAELVCDGITLLLAAIAVNAQQT